MFTTAATWVLVILTMVEGSTIIDREPRIVMHEFSSEKNCKNVLAGLLQERARLDRNNVGWRTWCQKK